MKQVTANATKVGRGNSASKTKMSVKTHFREAGWKYNFFKS